MSGERGGEEGFGFGGMVFGEEHVGEARGGFGIVCEAGSGEVAAEGLLGGGEIGGCFGDLGGEEDVLGLLGSEMEGFEEFCGCGGGVGGFVEARDILREDKCLASIWPVQSDYAADKSGGKPLHSK